ncbi:unnamed protein product [Rotaria magnacalcarata]|uniref:Reverse transcriptase domain-containing protein n=3 Tax=Rotaria magnacalcarata TaxID=392030 RepID=A0A820IBK6_9BILA|nr:unnamed protein product [Rotaria magnacalcarata]
MYADDIAVMCQSTQELEKFIKAFEIGTQDFGLTMNIKKMCLMSLRQFQKSTCNSEKRTEIDHEPCDITIRNQKIEKADEFNYLGCYVSKDQTQYKDIETRVSKASSAFNSLRRIVWYRKCISIQAKIRTFRASVLPVLLYGIIMSVPRLNWVTGIGISSSSSSSNLGRNQISAEGIQFLANALETNKTLTSLNLGGNELGSNGIEILATALQYNNTLSALYVGRNSVGIGGAQHLANLLNHNSKLVKLDLQSNEISDGIQYLADALQNNITLKTLNLARNNIGDKGAYNLANALEYNNVK